MAQKIPPNERAFQQLVSTVGKAHLARLLGISPQAITKWTAVPATRAVALAAALDCPVEKIRPEPYAPPYM